MCQINQKYYIHMLRKYHHVRHMDIKDTFVVQNLDSATALILISSLLFYTRRDIKLFAYWLAGDSRYFDQASFDIVQFKAEEYKDPAFWTKTKEKFPTLRRAYLVVGHRAAATNTWSYLTVQSKRTGRFTIPGGDMQPDQTTLYETATNHFLSQTKEVVPQDVTITNIFVYNKHTVIFSAIYTDPPTTFDTNSNTPQDSPTIASKMMTLGDIKATIKADKFDRNFERVIQYIIAESKFTNPKQ